VHTQSRWLLLIAASLFSLTALAVPATVELDGQKLVLNGTGMREATIFKVDVYKGALYLPTKQRDGAAILAKDQAWQLDLHFVRDVEKEKLTEAWKEGFKKNAPKPGKAKAGLAKLNGWMQDMKSGQLMRLRYVPGKGTAVSLAGKKKGSIAGADFGQAMLSVWLGKSPPNAGLKKGLLGG